MHMTTIWSRVLSICSATVRSVLIFSADPAALWSAAARLPQYGITGFLPTIISSAPERIAAAQGAIMDLPRDFQGARPLGLHLEGPFLNPEKKGAHNAAWLRPPDDGLAADWSPDTGVRMVTLAPELPGALELIEKLAARGILVSAGHSIATHLQARAGLAAGVGYGTHLFNAMSGLHHREPGLAAALLAHPDAVVGLIADGIHVDPLIIDLVWRLVGSRRLNLVSDSISALGMPEGRHRLGDQEVMVKDNAVRLKDGTLAGSVLGLDQAVRNLMRFTGSRLRQVLASVTTTPARLLGLDGQYGLIEPGRPADLVLLDNSYRVVKTFVGGSLVFEAD